MAVADLSRVSEERRAGRLYKLSPASSDSVAIDNQSAVAVDETAMSATAVISTPTPDRVSDVVNPRGCVLENYKNNPVVMLEHGFFYPLPIATSEDPSGRLTVALSDAGVTATSYFTDKTLESAQVFDLIAAKILRATSIRLSAIESRFEQREGDSLHLIDQWELEEWSWCAIGCNPEALAGTIGKNRLAGRPITEPVLKSLKLWLPKSSARGRGWTPPKDETMSRTTKITTGKAAGKPVSDKPPKDVTKAAPEDDDDETGGESASDETNDDTATGDDTSTDTEGESGGDGDAMKYGAQVLSAAHAMLSDLVQQTSAATAALENEIVKAAIDDMLAACQEKLAGLEGCYSECYEGEMPSVAKSSPVTDTDGDSVREFLLAGQGARHQFSGLVGRIKSVSRAKNLTPDQRKSLEDAARQFTGIVAKASATKQTSASNDATKAAPSGATRINNALVDVLTEMKTGLDEFRKSLDEIRPKDGHS